MGGAGPSARASGRCLSAGRGGVPRCQAPHRSLMKLEPHVRPFFHCLLHSLSVFLLHSDRMPRLPRRGWRPLGMRTLWLTGVRCWGFSAMTRTAAPVGGGRTGARTTWGWAPGVGTWQGLAREAGWASWLHVTVTSLVRNVCYKKRGEETRGSTSQGGHRCQQGHGDRLVEV